ncbi:hypothetical protein ACRE_062370 [Hapsidospora chrysogenum ATCC 11550]|uniref:WSC domain-containing protein n=1 Tax=Hapsidospora chrysogenum (strain ATCC 11550 / CBS 779.69 / DSM 880 / IAM 14645 / JCM 23072 / IMI 49137) TaxID=857340 RepID=A0A086T0Z4_HAPC1|nr:hypothetical protein ACRE_062370 [Hapsidospora chrysogenum ATCC 11550]
MSSSAWGSNARFGPLLLLAAAAIIPVRAAVPLDLCASFNTASMDKNISIYQTNGLCSDFCRDDYAWAITQAESCWCSNYTPDDDTQVDMKKCDITCPAFPDEFCGGRGGLYGYVELKVQLPSGTKGPDDSKTTTSVTPSSTKKTTSKPTSRPSPATSVRIDFLPSWVSADAQTDDDPSSTSTVQTLTTDGTIKTVTVLPTSSDEADGSNDGGSDGGSGGGNLGAGPIAGIVIGVVAAIAILAAIAFFFRRRKRNQADGYKGDPSVRGNSSDRMGSAHPEMTMGGGASPSSAAVGGSNRNSTLAIDPRMDPFKQGLYGRSGSHESVNTLRDDHDYSRRIQQPRVLRATNPDPNNDD